MVSVVVDIFWPVVGGGGWWWVVVGGGGHILAGGGWWWVVVGGDIVLSNPKFFYLSAMKLLYIKKTFSDRNI